MSVGIKDKMLLDSKLQCTRSIADHSFESTLASATFDVIKFYNCY